MSQKLRHRWPFKWLDHDNYRWALSLGVSAGMLTNRYTYLPGLVMLPLSLLANLLSSDSRRRTYKGRMVTLEASVDDDLYTNLCIITGSAITTWWAISRGGWLKDQILAKLSAGWSYFLKGLAFTSSAIKQAYNTAKSGVTSVASTAATIPTRAQA